MQLRNRQQRQWRFVNSYVILRINSVSSEGVHFQHGLHRIENPMMMIPFITFNRSLMPLIREHIKIESMCSLWQSSGMGVARKTADWRCKTDTIKWPSPQCALKVLMADEVDLEILQANPSVKRFKGRRESTSLAPPVSHTWPYMKPHIPHKV